MAARLETRELKEVVPGDIRTTRFFNGRLLTAGDLEAEQATRQAQRLQLARALGEGIAHGLEVAEHPDSGFERPVVTVEPGLALAASGRPVELTRRVDLALLRAKESVRGGGEGGGLFADCAPPSGGVYTAGRAVYLLVASPAQTDEGRVPSSAGSTTSCGPLAVVEGVAFRLVQVALPPADLKSTAHLRNLVAHRLLGTDDPRLTGFRADPRGPVPRAYGLLDDLRADCLGLDDVPLATIGWRTTTASGDAGALRDEGIQFVDMWPVRRSLARDDPRQRYPLLTGARRRRELEAAFFQFTDEIEDLVAAAGARRLVLSEVTAASRFDYLPAVGILPFQQQPAARPTGFDPRPFFGAQALPGIAALDADALPDLVREGCWHEPVRVESADRVKLYVIAENMRSRLPDGRLPEPVLVFAKSTIPYRGTAWMGWSAWDHDRYARTPL